MCPKCNNPLVIRNGRYGEFVACSNFQSVNISNQPKEVKEIIPCPTCDGTIVEKPTRKEKSFMDVIIIQNVKLLIGINQLEENVLNVSRC